MWKDANHYGAPSLPPPFRISKSAPCSPIKPLLKRTPSQPDSFHVIHKVPAGDTPYVKAKHMQLVEKDPNRAIALFWAAINAGDRVDSALKDMAIVMKQQNRAEEAIEAIKSLRNRCSDQAQESLDNVLLDLYKRCGRLDDQIALLKHKLHLIHLGLAFNGKRTKTARSQGKKFQVSIEQEASRLLGNLGWAYMQQNNYSAAEVVYRKALSIEPDNNKVCNLGICLMKQGRICEAKTLLETVKLTSTNTGWGIESHLKSYERAQEMLRELESSIASIDTQEFADYMVDIHRKHNSVLQSDLMAHEFIDAAVSGAFYATSGFGPLVKPSFGSQMQAFSDENSNISNGLALKQGTRDQDMQWHAEAVRQKLASVSLDRECDKLERSFSFPAPLPGSTAQKKHVLNISAPPFIAKGAQEMEAEKLPLMMDCSNYLNVSNNTNQRMNFNSKGSIPNKSSSSRRSLSLESFDEKQLRLTACTENFLGSSPAAGALASAAICRGTSRVVKSSQALFCPLKENTAVASPAPSKPLDNKVLSLVKQSCETWSDLGFTQSPDKLDYEGIVSIVGSVMAEVVAPHPPAPPATIATATLDGPAAAERQKSLMNATCNRRLKVFQQMTLPASPHA